MQHTRVYFDPIRQPPPLVSLAGTRIGVSLDKHPHQPQVVLMDRDHDRQFVLVAWRGAPVQQEPDEGTEPSVYGLRQRVSFVGVGVWNDRQAIEIF